MDKNVPAPWAHQKSAIEMSQRRDCLGLFFDVGTGKTRTFIDIFRHRCAAHDRLLKCLIVSPKITLVNWKREIAKYSRIHPWDVVILDGSGAKRKKTFQDAVLDGHQLKKPKVIITNYESFQMEDLFKMLMEWAPEVVCADEAHRLKNHESKRAKRVIQVGDLSLYRYALTGTPVANTGMDIFNLFRFLDKGETFGKNFYLFQSTWFEDANARWKHESNYFPKWEPRLETYKQFNDLIYRKALRAVKEDCLDLPPFVRKEIHVELGPEQKRLYNEMKEEYIAYVDDIAKSDQPRAVVAQMAITKALRLQQIVTGFAKVEDGTIHKIEENPRIKALEEMLEDLTPNHKVIVWSIFIENYADIKKVCEKIGVKYVELHGQIKDKDKQAAIDSFEKDPSVRVFIGHPKAGGIGVNLVASDVTIMYSKGHSYLDDVQAEGRNYRGGSEKHKSVTRYDIIATNTIDDLISQALANKQDISNQILNWRREDL